MTRGEHQQSSGRPIWVPRMQTAGQSVETLQLRSGATLILSRFDPGERQSFCFIEPEDNFGFGFHLKGGAQFELENGPFQTQCWDVWSVASPQGSTSNFVLPAEGFATVSIRFKREVADAFFADGLGLPDSARPLLERVSEEVGSVRLPHLSPAAAWRLQSMFSTPYGDCFTSNPARLSFLPGASPAMPDQWTTHDELRLTIATRHLLRASVWTVSCGTHQQLLSSRSTSAPMSSR